MKTTRKLSLTFLTIVFICLAGFESYRTTTTDLYMRDLEAQMRKQIGYTRVNDLRAEQYRTLQDTQVYDSHHNPARIKERAFPEAEPAEKYSGPASLMSVQSGR